MNASQIRVQDIDHSGIVAGVIDEMGLVEQINQHLGQHPLQVVSPGQAVKAMILNGVGFVSAPLYLFEQFFVGKATEHLIGEGIQPEHLNDDRMGRVLEQLFEAGLTEVFVAVALKAVKQIRVATKSVHLDSSSFHVDGEYAAEPAGENPALPIISITHGYSRDHRADLKQFVVDLMCSGDGDIPLYLRVGDGNEADKAVFAQLIEQFQAQLSFDALFVADSALYSQENLQALSGLRWLSRVPTTLSEAKERLQDTPEAAFVASCLSGYRIARAESHYGGVEQRWLIVESEKRKASDLEHLSQQVAKQHKMAQSQLNQLSRRGFACEADARSAAIQLEKFWRYHQLAQVNILEQASKTKRGRPRKDGSSTQLMYFVQATVQQDALAIAIETRRAGRFILASNVLETEVFSDDELLQEYKAQQSVERGFRFLKDPLFFTSSVFLKSPQRVAALAMVMGLCLLVYSLGQPMLRQALINSKHSLKNQLKKPTQTPTLRWIFQCFQSVHLVTINSLKQIANLTEERKEILRFLGAACQKYYLLV